MLGLVAAGACAAAEELEIDARDLPGSDAGSNPDGARHADGGGGAGGSRGSGGSTGATMGGASGALGGAAGTPTGTGGTTGDAAFGDAPVAVDTGNGCVSGQKVCEARCVIPEARFGCGPADCTPCPSPAHSYAHCTGTQCDFDCLAGYERSGATCVPTEGGAGGGAGGAGTGGSSIDAGGRCVASQCGGCIPVIQAPCCKPDNTCGCMYPFAPCM
jgi:hypothetical protein